MSEAGTVFFDRNRSTTNLRREPAEDAQAPVEEPRRPLRKPAETRDSTQDNIKAKGIMETPTKLDERAQHMFRRDGRLPGEQWMGVQEKPLRSPAPAEYGERQTLSSTQAHILGQYPKHGCNTDLSRARGMMHVQPPESTEAVHTRAVGGGDRPTIRTAENCDGYQQATGPELLHHVGTDPHNHTRLRGISNIARKEARRPRENFGLLEAPPTTPQRRVRSAGRYRREDHHDIIAGGYGTDPVNKDLQNRRGPGWGRLR
mmetsp:Transcript_14891/g.32366  ORF Transcript_14891/g.32366 Transcript_14891/m.32366 type:complete len:259 (-) Transcript_14891:39-815(-)